MPFQNVPGHLNDSSRRTLVAGALVGTPPLQARLQHVLRCVLVRLWQHEDITWFEDNAVSCIISDLANQGGAPSKRTVFNVLQRLFVRGCCSGRMLPP